MKNKPGSVEKRSWHIISTFTRYRQWINNKWYKDKLQNYLLRSVTILLCTSCYPVWPVTVPNYIWIVNNMDYVRQTCRWWLDSTGCAAGIMATLLPCVFNSEYLSVALECKSRIWQSSTYITNYYKNVLIDLISYPGQ